MPAYLTPTTQSLQSIDNIWQDWFSDCNDCLKSTNDSRRDQQFNIISESQRKLGMKRMVIHSGTNLGKRGLTLKTSSYI